MPKLIRKTPFPDFMRSAALPMVLATLIFLCPACRDAGQVLENIIPQQDATQQLPIGEGLNINALAPNFSLPDANGNIHSLSDYRGQKVVIVFYRMGT